MSLRSIAVAAAVGLAAASSHANRGVVVDDMIHPLFESVKGNVENTTVETEGEFPEWLHVTKVNNGFGGFEGGEGKDEFEFLYLFDVLSYVAKWRIDGSEVSFASKLMDSSYAREAAVEIPALRNFGGTVPDMSPAKKIATLTSEGLSDNLNVNIQKFGKHVVGLSDTTGEMEIDEDTLETVGLYPYNDTFTGEMEVVTCAHPSKLANDAFVYNYQLSVLGGWYESEDVEAPNVYEIIRTDTTSEPLVREKLMTLPVPRGEVGYVHSFAHTPNYMVFFHFPLKWAVLTIPLRTQILTSMSWQPEGGTLVTVIDKRTWTVVNELRTVPMFAYHHVNAWEDPETGEVVADITTVPCEGASEDAKAACLHMNAFELETLRTGNFPIPRGKLLRFRVPTDNETSPAFIEPDTIGDASFDLPWVNEAYRGYENRYVWGAGNTAQEGVASTWYNAVIKVDLSTGESKEWFLDGHYPSEPNFVPRPGATEEDDGVILTTVLSKELGTSYLQVLDARTLEPIARAQAPMYLPFPSHGYVEQDPVA